jgi:molecular chaperone GrpE
MDSANMQAQRDAELRATGSVPEEVMSESPDEADMVAESSAETVLPQDIQALAERCRVAELKAEDEHDQLLRTLADFNNYRRRAREEMDQSRKFAIEDFTIRLLPILDNFERAIKASEELHDFDALHGGVVLILRNLNDVLEKEGVKPIEAEGQQFDPNIHEAVMRMETDDYPDNTIVEELQKGYTLGDKVIRASMVKVSCKP